MELPLGVFVIHLVEGHDLVNLGPGHPQTVGNQSLHGGVEVTELVLSKVQDRQECCLSIGIAADELVDPLPFRRVELESVRVRL